AVGGWEAGAVELGGPMLKETLSQACVESAQAGLLDGLKDLGGGGLSCVIGEMALAGGFGAEVDLEKVPLKEEGLAPWEIWVSESQERMMLAVRPENVDSVLKIFDLYDVPATVIGRVIPEKVCRVRYQGTVVLEMDLPFYTSGPEYSRPYEAPAALPSQDLRLPREPQDYRSTILKILASPNVASKEYVIRQYDHEVRASTVLKPLQGVIGKAAHGDASVIRPRIDSWRALAIAVTSTPAFTAIDPYRGGATAGDEVCRNLVSVGAGGRPRRAGRVDAGGPRRVRVPAPSRRDGSRSVRGPDGPSGVDGPSPPCDSRRDRGRSARPQSWRPRDRCRGDVSRRGCRGGP